MSVLRNLGLVFFLYYFALIQTSFLVHFRIGTSVFNFLFIFSILFNLLESPRKKSGLFYAAYCGFLVDIFSNRPAGFDLLLYLFIAVILKYILKKYVRISFSRSA